MSNNPCGLNGFAFLEFSGPDGQYIEDQFTRMGFTKKGKHSSQPIYQFQQGNIEFIINQASDCQASKHSSTHGAGACAMGFRVKDVDKAYDYAINHGAEPFEDSNHVNHHLPAIKAIGGSVIYFADKHHLPFRNEWDKVDSQPAKQSDMGLVEIDHLTHNVYQGDMAIWAEYYETIFNFKQIRYFDIEGQQTGLVSKAMGSPCGKIKIPLNESKDDKSQIEEFLDEYHGEGIQHIALSTNNIIQTVKNMVKNGSQFLDVPPIYYELVGKRIPWYQKPLDDYQKLNILIDGEEIEDEGVLLQIFTENVFGPVFFEIIERQGNNGFGEGNFQALFEAIERDQIRRGTLESL